MAWSSLKLAESTDLILAAGAQHRTRIFSSTSWWRLVSAVPNAEDGDLSGVVALLATGPVPGWTPTAAEQVTPAQVYGSEGPGAVLVANQPGTFAGSIRRLSWGADGALEGELIPEPVVYQPSQEFLAFYTNTSGANRSARFKLAWQEWL